MSAPLLVGIGALISVAIIVLAATYCRPAYNARSILLLLAIVAGLVVAWTVLFAALSFDVASLVVALVLAFSGTFVLVTYLQQMGGGVAAFVRERPMTALSILAMFASVVIILFVLLATR